MSDHDAKPTEQTPAKASPSKEARPSKGPVRRFIGGAWCLFLLVLATIFLLSSLLNGLAKLLFGRHDSIFKHLSAGDLDAASDGITNIVATSFFAFLALLIMATVDRRKQRSRSKVFAAIVLVVIGINVFGQLTPGLLRSVSDSQAEAFKTSTQELARSLHPTDGSLPSVPTAPLATEQTHGKLAPVVNATQEYMAAIASDRAQLDLQVAQLRLDHILMPARLDSAEELATSLAKLETAKHLTSEFYRKHEQHSSDYVAKAEAMDLPIAERDGLVAGLKHGMRRTRAAADRIEKIGDAIYDEMAALVRFMEDQLGSFTVEDDLIAFETDEQIIQYQLSIARIDGLSMAESKLLLQIEDSTSRFANGQLSESESGTLGEEFLRPRGSDRLEITSQGVTLNDEPLVLPLSLSAVSEILGKPEVTRENGQAVYKWPDRRVYGFSPNADDHIQWLSFLTTRDHGFEDFTDMPFSGRIHVDGAVVDEYDTPITINRKTESLKFGLFDTSGMAWGLFIPGGSVTMAIEQNGLSVEINIVSDMEHKSTAPPRF